MKIIEHKTVSWVDFEEPSHDDILYLHEHFNIHPLAIEEFFTPTYQPKIVNYDNCLFLSIHIPLFDVENRTTYSGELDMIITKDHLITAHRHRIYQLEKFFHDISTSEGKRRLHLTKTPAHLLYTVLNILLESCFPRLDHISKNLDHIEDQVFAEKEKEMVLEISIVKRDILNFRRAVKPQRAIIESILQKENTLIPSDLKPYFQDLIGTNIRIWNILENNKEIIESLEETNNSLLSNKLDMTMKVLTIFSAILLPVTAYSNIMSMSVSIPLTHSPNAFWLHAGIIIIISILTIIIFRLKKWF
ncbi:MAG: magnesium transporter CorA family protein [Candidatus Moranbacteria bacterium]|nr:magnesium transporter CorA family protein [Candidatus Moranbacteria bacterium]